MILNHTALTKNISVILIDLISKRINHSFNPLTHWPWHKLEQLERLRSEDTPPPPHDYPHYWVMLDPKSKQGRMTLKI